MRKGLRLLEVRSYPREDPEEDHHFILEFILFEGNFGFVKNLKRMERFI